MKRNTATLSLVALVLMVSTGMGIDKNGNYVGQGAGVDSCGSYSESRRQRGSAENKYRSWVMGFFTGVNYSAQDTYDVTGGTNLDGVLGWLDNYCRDHPLETFARAMERLLVELRPKLIKQAPTK
ncbi:MAG: hypothetical protein U1E51_16435 [Candidatus Binatia bacterium]|nr:hypothetical protein [Candidatus Binatia bacterium]